MLAGERQVAPELSGIRRDHRARYEFAAAWLPPASRVIDLACGVGYGAAILAAAGHSVLGLDRDGEAIEYARKHYKHPRVLFTLGDAEATLNIGADGFDAAVCFETIEHLSDPLPMLRALARSAKVLLASVPNEECFPYRCEANGHRGWAFHHRHYTRAEFEALLTEAGFRVTGWFGQEGPQSEVAAGVNGRTTVVVAEKVAVHQIVDRYDYDAPKTFAQAPAAVAAGPAPNEPVSKHIAIIGLGPSAESYMDLVKRLGGRHRLADEVWAINALGDVLACDRVFHMDDVRIQEIRAAAKPDSNIAVMLRWLKKHPGPIVTSRAHPDYPGLVEFPLEDVINDLGYAYFNSTAAYAVAYAIHIGATRISMFGCDFTYPDAHHAERGKGCVEYWLGFARARGVEIVVAGNSSLLDGCVPEDQRLYGYDTLNVAIDAPDDGVAKVTFTPKTTLPTAEEIERRYDHSKHPSPLVSAAK